METKLKMLRKQILTFLHHLFPKFVPLTSPFPGIDGGFAEGPGDALALH